MNRFLVLSCLVIFSAAGSAQPGIPFAQEVLTDAYKKAADEHKNVLLIFHASWCGWCHRMDSSINDPSCRKFFEDNYVITYLTVHESTDKKQFENHGSDELLKQYKAFDSGIPFWVVLDKNGNLLKDSFLKNPDGTSSIIGCPASEKEVAAFIKILEETSSLTNSELSVITKVFRLNETK